MNDAAYMTGRMAARMSTTPDLTASVLGQRLRQERLRLGLTQTQVSICCGLGGKTVWINYEMGRRVPSALTISKFAAIGARLDVLLKP